MALPLVRTGAGAGTWRTNDSNTQGTGKDFTKQRTNKEGNEMKQYKLSSEHIAKIDQLANDLLRAFDWLGTPEGVEFWDDVHRKLTDKVKYGTTDGKPWVEPELTDEDAQKRCWVMARDRDSDPWQGPRRFAAKASEFYYAFTSQDDIVIQWRQCRRATPEEIEAANVR